MEKIATHALPDSATPQFEDEKFLREGCEKFLVAGVKAPDSRCFDFRVKECFLSDVTTKLAAVR